MNFGGIVSSIQDVFCGSGNWRLKEEGRLEAASKKAPSWKAQEHMSDIVFCFPGMWSGMMEDVWRVLWQRERNQRRQDAGMDLELYPLWHHETVEVLSQKEPMCLNLRLEEEISRMSHPITSPANSKSFMERRLSWKRALMSGGHLYCHTIHGKGNVPGPMMPPQPR